MSADSKKPKYSDLKVDRDLLDPKFEGYKLCLDRLKTEFKKLPTDVQATLASSEQWSYQHVRLFSGHNHLHLNPWTIGQKIRHVYAILMDGIYRFSIEQGQFTIGNPERIADLAFPADFSDRTDKFFVSMAFPAENLSIVSDGCGNLVFYTVSEQWRISHRAERLCDGRAFVVLDSRTRTKESAHFVDVLVEYVEETQRSDAPGNEGALFSTVIEWVTFKKGSENAAFAECRRRRLRTKGSLDYAALSTDCDAICCMTSKPIRFIFDSEKPVVEVEESESRDVTEVPKLYSWGQTGDEVSAVFTIGEQISKDDIVWRLTSENVHIGIEQQDAAERVLLDGDLHLPVDVEGSTWIMETGRLEISLSKRDAGRMWTEIVNGDQHGEYVADPELVKEVSERLKQFTSDGESRTADEGIPKAPFNVQQLEECDAVDSDACHFSWLDGETHEIVAEADVGGHQWLFNVRLNPDHPPHICLRHDVDGILWRLSDGPAVGEARWTHEFTFNAFGYVQAGKPDRKFCTCSTDGSYAVVADCTRHAYVYWQPLAVDSDLRNRKTGQRISKVAKQQLVSLSAGGGDDASIDILGIVALNDILLLLTENRLIGVFVK